MKTFCYCFINSYEHIDKGFATSTHMELQDSWNQFGGGVFQVLLRIVPQKN